jgi:hypothetical protein
MKLPCIAYATDVAYQNNRFEFTRIISGGSQLVGSKNKPAIVTVAKYEFPLFPTFAGTRRANDTEIIKWSADDVKPTAVGVGGSKTRVIRVFPPEKTSRKCQEIKDIREFAQTIKSLSKSAGNDAAQVQNTNHRYILPEKRTSLRDRSFEGTQKESEAFHDLVKKLDELGIKTSRT